MQEMSQEPLQKIIGSRVRQHRERMNMSQEKCAELAGMYQANLSLLENGKSSPDISTLERLAEALDCRVSDFLKE